jgi:hypothetical protein
MRRTIYLVGPNNKLPSIEQLIERAFKLLAEAYIRVGSAQSFDALVEAVELLDKRGLRAQEHELMLLTFHDERDSWVKDQSIENFLNISLAYCVEAQRTLRDEDVPATTYAVIQAYYHLGMASGPQTESERATKRARKKASDKFGPLKDEAIRLFKENCPDKSHRFRAGAIEAIEAQLIKFNDALYPENIGRACAVLVESWCRKDERFKLEIKRIKYDASENRKS